MKVARRIDSVGVIETLADAIYRYGNPDHIRYDNGPKMFSNVSRKLVAKVGSQINHIAPILPWHNRYYGHFDANLKE